MIKYFIFPALFFSFMTSNLFGQSSKAYNAGEQLYYEAYYGWVTGAKALLELRKTTYSGDTVYYARATGYTVGMIDKMYSVKEVFESYFHTETSLPLKAVENVKEGKYERYVVVLFDHKENQIYTKKTGQKKVPENTFDVISAFFHLRNKNIDNIKVGDIIKIQTYFQNEPWELAIQFKGYESIKLKIGKLKCMKFRPQVQKEGVFKDEDALTIWISADKNRIPVRAQMDLLVGSFKIDLMDYKGLTHNIPFE